MTYSSKTVAALRAECKARGIHTTTRMIKADLIYALCAHDKATSVVKSVRTTIRSQTGLALIGGTALTDNALSIAEFHRSISPAPLADAFAA